MHCPLCGEVLELVPRDPCPDIDWGDPGYEEQMKAAQEWEKCQRKEYKCPVNECFMEDFPLYMHHPFGGIDSRPGDSWSLSWVK